MKNSNTNKTEAKFLIEPSRLEGKVTLSGAKNSALKLLTATILTDEEVTLENYPASLFDAKIHVEMLRLLGKRCDIDEGSIRISCAEELKEELMWDGPSIRNTLLIFGALLARKKRAKIPLPGGCNLGNRKYDLHKMILEKMGATIWEEGDYLLGEAKDGLAGAEIFLPIRSTGATENAILAGSLAKDVTNIWGPHIRPEILELISFLRKFGAKIEVFGQERIQVEGIDCLSGGQYKVMPDNMEAITFLIGAAITGGDVEIEQFPFKDLEVPLIFLRESGVKFYQGKDSLIVRGGHVYPVEIATGPYPGINSDMQPLFSVFGVCARGESRVIDLRFPDRYGYVEELKKLGANIRVKNNIVIITGGAPLQGTDVTALDLRCGATLLLAGLVAEGNTIIHNAQQIQRGYEYIDLKMQRLGARMVFQG